MVKVNAIEPALVLYSTLDCINPVASEKRNLEIVHVHHYFDTCFSYLVVRCRTSIHLCHTLDMSQW
jgi:hypothetical protein